MYEYKLDHGSEQLSRMEQEKESKVYKEVKKESFISVRHMFYQCIENLLLTNCHHMQLMLLAGSLFSVCAADSGP